MKQFYSARVLTSVSPLPTLGTPSSAARSVIPVLAFAALAANATNPSLTYFPDIGATTVFAVDAQTNLYAYHGGIVYEYSGSGAPVSTNAFCPAVGIPQRDGAGNFYFSGTFSPPQDFGGVTLTNGRCFLAKYTATGTLLWAKSFNETPSGPSSPTVIVRDVQVDPSGAAYVGYVPGPMLVKYSADGTKLWEIQLPLGQEGQTIIRSVRVGVISLTNGYALATTPATLSRFDGDGTVTQLNSWPVSASAQIDGRPVGDSLCEIYNVEGTSLTKRTASGVLLWSVPIEGQTNLPAWTAGQDYYGGVHVALEYGPMDTLLCRFDADGNLVWTLSLPSPCAAMVSDSCGNRFISLDTGAIARLGAESVSPPLLTNSPQGLTVLAGTDVVMAAGASGSGPLRYYWYYQGTLLSGPTTVASIDLGPVTSAQAGTYWVVASNSLGAVTSAPALLRVKNVALFSGGQLLTNGNYTFPAPANFSIQSSYVNGSFFYTTDGSAPSFASTYYSGPFTVSNTATVRAIGYSSDFSQSEEADAINVTILPTTISIAPSANGQVLVSPAGPYNFGSVVRLTALPQSGYYFGFWGNAATGNTNPLYFAISAPTQTVSAIFAPVPSGQAALTVLINGGGRVTVSPRANVYPTNQMITLAAQPDGGQFFLNWSGDANGTQNPLTLAMTQSRVVNANFLPNVTQTGLFVIPAAGDGLSPSGFRFSVINPTQTVWDIFNSSDLSSWTLLGTVTNTQQVVPFTDPGAVGRTKGFYKEQPRP